MGVRPGYKQTEVGLIPDDWEVSTVGREFDVRLGKMLDAEKNAGELKPYIGNSNVQWGEIDVSDLPLMRMTRSDLHRFRLLDGDLLVCEGGEVGRAAIWSSPVEECYYQKALHRLRPTRGFDRRLMIELLSLWSKRGGLANYVTQTSIAHLPREKFIEMPLPVPTGSEQSAIATAIADTDALLVAQDALIDKKRTIKQGAMQELLSGKRRLPGFFGNWGAVRLGELGWIYGGLTGKGKQDFGQGAAQYVPFVNVVANVVVDMGALDKVDVCFGESQNLVLKGDLLFNGSSETPEEVALCALVADDVENLYLNSFCFGFRLKERERAHGLFLSYYMRSQTGRDLIKSLAQGSTRYNLSKSAFLDSLLMLPGAEEQEAIAKVLSDMDAEITALQQQRDKTAQLKQGMMQQLLTGRIRLI